MKLRAVAGAVDVEWDNPSSVPLSCKMPPLPFSPDGPRFLPCTCVFSAFARLCKCACFLRLCRRRPWTSSSIIRSCAMATCRFLLRYVLEAKVIFLWNISLRGTQVATRSKIRTHERRGGSLHRPLMEAPSVPLDNESCPHQSGVSRAWELSRREFIPSNFRDTTCK